MNKPKPFKNISDEKNIARYYDENGIFWIRHLKNGWFHFYRDFTEVGYMRAYRGSIKTVHEAFTL